MPRYAEKGARTDATRSGTVPVHASQMYAKNIATFLLHLMKDGAPRLDPEDEIIRETLVTRGGQVVHPSIREAPGLPVTGGRAA